MAGWISLHRKIKNSWFYKDSEAVHLWVHLLLKARHKDGEIMFNMKRHTLKAGQMITGRKALAEETGINENKIFRLLKAFVDEQLTEQQTNSRYTVVTIKNWNEYQQNEQQNAQPVNTNNNGNNGINNTHTQEKFYGEFQRVKLTDEDYSQFTVRCLSKKLADELIGELDRNLEAGIDFTKIDGHFARLLTYLNNRRKNKPQGGNNKNAASTEGGSIMQHCKQA